VEDIDLLEQIKRKLAALQTRIEARADPRLLAEVADTIRLADVHLPSVFMQARRVLEIIVRDIYRRELPDAKPKPLHNMIEALYQQKGLIDARIAGDLHYIRANGNLITHAQDEPIEPDPGDAEKVLFIFLGIVEWYLEDYLPVRTGTAPAAEPEGPSAPSPYRGLAPFRPQDAANYFGREPDIADLAAAVARQPLLAVVGPSGSGKSSLLQAGLLPALAAEPGPAGPWLTASFRPGARPFHQLARALLDHWPLDDLDRLARTPKLAAALAAEEITLADAAAETLRQAAAPDQAAPPSRLLLIADQFEELFTLAPTPGTEPQAPRPERFIDRLIAAVAATPAGPPPSLCLLLALRADFLGHALAHPDLAALLDRHKPKLLGAIADRDRLRAIIEEPARRLRPSVLFEDLLPERILRDLGQLPDDPDRPGGASLPLLQFTLTQLWERQQGRRLTHRAYETLGGIEHALSGHADAVLNALDPADQARMRHCLVQMVRPGEGTEDTRQVATRDQLRPDDWPLITRLADQHARLVVTGHDPATDQDTAELVHEALIRHWHPLRRWIGEDRAFRLWQNGLRQAIAEWRRTDQDRGSLLAGARLAEAEERVEQDRDRLAEAEIAFIAASVARRDAESATRERRRRHTISALAGFLAVASLLTGLAAWQWWIADQRGAHLAVSLEQEAAAREDADAQRRLAQSETRAANQARRRADAHAVLAGVNLAEANERAAEALIERIDTDGTDAHRRAFLHLLEAQRQPTRGRFQLHRTALNRVVDGARSLPAAPVWRSPSPKLANGTRAVAWSPDGWRLATGLSDGTIRLFDPVSGAEVQRLEGHGGTVLSVAWDTAGGRLASGGDDGSVRVWDVAAGAEVQRLEGHGYYVLSVAWDPAGGHLASGGDDGSVRVWDLATGAEVQRLEGHGGWVESVAWDPAGGRLASGGHDGSVRLWDLATGVEVLRLEGHGGWVESVAWDPAGGRLASGGQDGNVRVWDLATGAEVQRLEGHLGDIESVAWHPAGGRLASGGQDGNVRVWDLATGAEVQRLEGHGGWVQSVAWNPAGKRLASLGPGNWGRGAAPGGAWGHCPVGGVGSGGRATGEFRGRRQRAGLGPGSGRRGAASGRP